MGFEPNFGHRTVPLSEGRQVFAHTHGEGSGARLELTYPGRNGGPPTTYAVDAQGHVLTGGHYGTPLNRAALIRDAAAVLANQTFVNGEVTHAGFSADARERMMQGLKEGTGHRTPAPAAHAP